MRNFGLGVNNAFSRIGGLLSPYALLARHLAWPYGPELIFAVLSLVAAGLVFLLPHDKKGGWVGGGLWFFGGGGACSQAAYQQHSSTAQQHSSSRTAQQPNTSLSRSEIAAT